ncbi:MaoC family dehydratase [Sphingomonas sp.]|uniref:MaoC family dehydratase n=1 Tax=Sphingomonas sp. TaxID=28214 RepID=UPI00286B934C|nr:MaoC family dehydratase [Sphingomonas sp.]
MAGLYFDQFTVGQRFVHELRRTVLESDNMLFSNMTMNPAAIHIDHEYAKHTEYGRPLVNSLLTLGLLIGLSVQDTTLGTTIANVKLDETNFPRPVFAGDTIRVETEVVALRPSKSRPSQGLVTLLHTAFNQRDEVVCTCQRLALMMKSPAA